MTRQLARSVFAALLGISLVMFLLPGSDVPPGPNDKLVHASIFVLLAVAGRWAGARVLPLAVGLAAYAVVTEILQAVLPIHRDGDVHDVLADVIGVGVGLLLSLAATRLGARARPPRSRSR